MTTTLWTPRFSRPQRGCFFMSCLETSSDAFPNAHRRPRMFRHSAQRIPIRSPNFRTPSIKISSFVNVISSGSPSRMRMVRRISFGITTRPRSSMRLTIPVAFTVSFSFVCKSLPLVFAGRKKIYNAWMKSVPPFRSEIDKKWKTKQENDLQWS